MPLPKPTREPEISQVREKKVARKAEQAPMSVEGFVNERLSDKAVAEGRGLTLGDINTAAGFLGKELRDPKQIKLLSAEQIAAKTELLHKLEVAQTGLMEALSKEVERGTDLSPDYVPLKPLSPTERLSKQLQEEVRFTIPSDVELAEMPMNSVSAVDAFKKADPAKWSERVEESEDELEQKIRANIKQFPYKQPTEYELEMTKNLEKMRAEQDPFANLSRDEMPTPVIELQSIPGLTKPRDQMETTDDEAPMSVRPLDSQQVTISNEKDQSPMSGAPTLPSVHVEQERASAAEQAKKKPASGWDKVKKGLKRLFWPAA